MKKMVFFLILWVFLITGCSHAPILPRDRAVNFLTKQPPHENQWKADGRNRYGFSPRNYLKTRARAIQDITDHDMQVINEGNRITVLIPTDKFFVFDTSDLSELKYAYLNDIVKLIQCFPGTMVYVAGFTDDVGSKAHKKTLSQNRAQAVLAYLWAKGIPQAKLNAEGYSDRFTIGNNQLIHGSAYNRRVEVQWYT